MAGTHSNIRFDEIWINFEAFLAVIECEVDLLELDPDGAAVRVDGDALWVALQPLFVLLEGFFELALLEEFIALDLESFSLFLLLG